ncbi:MAG: LacI family transcriptional regulator [Lachnospiraceae bacterium]|nr:LacI family transcriptional regulator [Lachnospiraceae bacterium]
MKISEIAKMAGVSAATVSRYFNNGYLSEEKREAIRRVVEATGYEPSLQAQMLRTKVTHTLGVIVPKIDSDSIGRVVTGISETAEKLGYRIILGVSQMDESREGDFLVSFNKGMVDGIIFLATVITDDLSKKISESEAPVVICGQYYEQGHCVYHDEYHAMYDMARHVLRCGRNKVGYIGGKIEDKAYGGDRQRGFEDAMVSAGIIPEADRMVVEQLSVEGGYAGAEMLLRAHGDTNAIVCATDRTAVGAIKYIRNLGLRVPTDIIVTGQGDSILARNITPSITSLQYYYEECGRESVEMMMRIINGEEAGKNVKLSYSLIERESTRV